MAQVFPAGMVDTIFDKNLKCTLYKISDIIEYFTGNTYADAIKDYLKKMKLRDVSLAKDWDKLVVFRPIKTNGGTQTAKFTNLEGVCRLVLALPAKRAFDIRAKIAQHAANAFLMQIEDLSDKSVIMPQPQN